jgi:3-oxoacyl-[acyl-carrier protein] reductase
MLNLSGDTAIVTGAGGGIGRASAIMLAQCGADVAVMYRNSADGARETVERIRAAGGRAEMFRCDLTVEEEAAAAFREAERVLGSPANILVNNAGDLVERRLTVDMTEDAYRRIMDVNMKSTVLACKYTIPGMRARGGGRIVNMTSLAAHNGGGPGASIYAAGKAAVMAYTKALAKELAADGIRVNAVSPGFIGGTAFHETHTSPAAREAAVKGVPLGREGTPEDVAGAVLFLVSRLSSYITGETIEVNGGSYMR